MGDNYGAMTNLSYLMNCLPQVNETSSKKRSFAQYLSLFWLVRQSRAAVEPKLVTKYTHQLIYRVAHMYLNDFLRLFRGHWVT